MKFWEFLLIIATVIAFLWWAYNATKMISCAKDRRHLWRRETRWNPFNCFFHPDLLSDEGLVYRQRVGYAWAAFFLLLFICLYFIRK